MRGSSLGIALVAGCAAQHHSGPTGDPRCAAQVSLDGSTGSSAPTVVGPIAVDDAGVDVCLELDATRNARVHFAASTAQEAGTSSSFLGTLQDASLQPVVDGWDVTIGNASPHTFMNLEWGPPVGEVTTVTLWVRARAATATTTIDVALFDPLE